MARRAAAIRIRSPRRRASDQLARLFLTLYILFLMLPIYWLVNMSFKTNNEIIDDLHAVAAAADARTTT